MLPNMKKMVKLMEVSKAIWHMLLLMLLAKHVITRAPMAFAMEADNERFAVSLTTIPPRFSTVFLTVKSWIEQDLPPEYVL